MRRLSRLMSHVAVAVFLTAIQSPWGFAAEDGGGGSSALIGEAEALRASGQFTRATELLERVLNQAGEAGDKTARSEALNGLGSLDQAAGRLPDAERRLTAALALATEIQRADVLGAVWNNLGNLRAAQERYDDALAAYQEATDLARRAELPVLRAQSLSNAARVSLRAGRQERARILVAEALGVSRKLADSHDKAYLLLSLGQIQSRFTPADAAQQGAYQTLNAALAVAEAIHDDRSRSYALGYMAQLYEHQGRTAEALELNRRAIVAVRQLDAPEMLYRWYWQQARLKNRLNDVDGAIADYRLAVFHLQAIRADLPLVGASGRSSFREVLGPLYFELADLLLKRATTATSEQGRQSLLKEARHTIELSKAAELQDYFQDSCVTAQQTRLGARGDIHAGVAVVYPILLPDRLELVVDFSDGIKQFTLPVQSAQLTETARRFRLLLEKRTTREYLPFAQELYGWLMRPLEGELTAHGIKTLVFVPDGPLRTIPMGALHDGTHFLVERYALATTPSLALTDTEAASAPRAPRALLNGLTEAVQGFSALPNVGDELQAIGELYRGKTLMDRDYRVDSVEQELDQTPYSVVHIASHGQFQSDVRNTFLLAYDGKLTMDELEKMISSARYRDQPISLLTLSACQTAAGDDRAALGLAGVAVKAGARSALASLWFINDQSATLLVSAFYHQLKQPGVNKAGALQYAQLKLIADKRYNHPCYWSPFLLIGSWN